MRPHWRESPPRTPGYRVDARAIIPNEGAVWLLLYAPPQGGVAARLRKYREASADREAGWFSAESTTCPWRIAEITRRWASGRGRDSAAATGTKKSLMASAPSQDLAVVLPSPSAHVVD